MADAGFFPLSATGVALAVLTDAATTRTEAGEKIRLDVGN
jgi:hypothetical protein